MRRGAWAAWVVRVSTAGMCRKTPDPSPTTELPRRSGRRTTALQPEESAELTATSGSAQTALKIYKLEQYLLNGTPFTTSVPCAVTNQNAAIGVFVCTRGNQIVVDFGTHTYSFSKSAAERGRVGEDTARTDDEGPAPEEALRRHRERNRSAAVKACSESMLGSLLWMSGHLRTRMAALCSDGGRIDWMGQCNPTAPTDVWPGALPSRSWHARSRRCNTLAVAGARDQWIPEEKDAVWGRLWSRPEPTQKLRLQLPPFFVPEPTIELPVAAPP